MRLLDAELRRFFARRMVRGTAVVALVAIAVGVSVVAVRSRVREATAFGPPPEFIERCLGPDGTVDRSLPGCRELTAPTTRRVDERFHLDTSLREAWSGTGVALSFVGLLLGASFVGAEFGAASLSTLLLFEPRRRRLLTTKLVAVALGTALLAVVVLAVLGLALGVAASARGVVGDLDGGWWRGRAGDAGRIALATGLGAVLGAGITAVTRRTVAAVVAFLVLAFILEPVLLGVFEVFDGRLPLEALFSLATNDTIASEGLHGLGDAGRVAGAWTVAVVVVALVDFSRREVR